MKNILLMSLWLLSGTLGYAKDRKKSNGDMPYIDCKRADEKTLYFKDKVVPSEDTAKISQFISSGITPNNIADHTGCVTILNNAIRLQKIDVVECLLRNGADPNLRARDIRRSMFSDAVEYEFTNYPLEEAANDNSIPKMELLIKYGADVNRCIPQLNEIAAKKGNTQMMLFIGQKTGVNATPANALAVMTDYSYQHDASTVTVETIRQLVKMGVDVNAYSPSGKTVLINVIQNKQITNKMPLIKELVANGSKLELTDRVSDAYKGVNRYYPVSPINAAIRNRDLQLVKYLVEAGAVCKHSLGEDTSDEIKEYLILKCGR